MHLGSRAQPGASWRKTPRGGYEMTAYNLPIFDGT
jgi:hypothetical protein